MKITFKAISFCLRACSSPDWKSAKAHNHSVQRFVKFDTLTGERLNVPVAVLGSPSQSRLCSSSNYAYVCNSETKILFSPDSGSDALSYNFRASRSNIMKRGFDSLNHLSQ